MSSTTEKSSIERATGLALDGAGEPPGEPAPPPGIVDRVPDEIRRLLPELSFAQLERVE